MLRSATATRTAWRRKRRRKIAPCHDDAATALRSQSASCRAPGPTTPHTSIRAPSPPTHTPNVPIRPGQLHGRRVWERRLGTKDLRTNDGTTLLTPGANHIRSATPNSSHKIRINDLGRCQHLLEFLPIDGPRPIGVADLEDLHQLCCLLHAVWLTAPKRQACTYALCHSSV